MARKVAAQGEGDGDAAKPSPRQDAVVRVSDLKPNPRNPNKHNEEQIKRLAASLRKDGQTKPVLARKENLMLIAGHGVREAALLAGLPELHVVLLDISQKAADRIMLGDNRQGELSKRDKARVSELLQELDAEEWEAAGFSDDEAQKLFSGVEAADLVVHEIETTDRRDIFWVQITGEMKDQAVVLDGLKEKYAHMEGIKIVLGTTPDLR